MTEHKRCGCVEQYHGSDCPACRGTGLIPPVTREEWDAASRAGQAKGLREAAEILRTAAAADARDSVHESAPHRRDLAAKMAENETVLMTRILARAEEVERG